MKRWFGVLTILALLLTGNQATGGASMAEKRPNRLISEKSPYLLQHAYNPVDWYPWGEEAFEKARKENKPIFLSIGYSTCHWCHVMEAESFSDPEVAMLMNEVFVSIKVDREERPDIDQVYMSVCQMISGHCGWPLNIIMTPDKKPFFAGTYIPKENRFGRIGMLELANRVKDLWSTEGEKVLNSAEKIVEVLKKASELLPGEELKGKESIDTAYKELSRGFDKEHGGFGTAPKFPTPHNLTFLLRYWSRTGDKNALEMVEKTLKWMRNGGIYDHIGYGFHRYSTDSEWIVPHFEKMLYDQAMLSMAYIETYQATGKEEYRKTAEEIFEYVLRDMTSPEGGFYSAEDADSEGEEGKFYLWTEEDIRQILGKKDSELVIKVFNIKKEGNFKDNLSDGHNRNILHLKRSLREIAPELKMSEKELKGRLERDRKKLFSVRERRVHPHKDDKILTDWNGLMIASLARGAQVFGELRYERAARKATEFILKKMRRPDGRLLHRYRDGEAGIDAYADDYAFLILGLIELYEATFDVSYLKSAIDLNAIFLKHFWDDKDSGFYFTADDSEKMIARSKEVYDGAVPSANSVALLNLFRLARMTADQQLEKKAMSMMKTFSRQIIQSPSAFTYFMSVIDFALGPSYEVVIAGDLKSKDTNTMLKALRKRFIPNKVVLFRPIGKEAQEVINLIGFMKYYTDTDGKATAYVCQNYNCKSPTTDVNKMMEMLK